MINRDILINQIDNAIKVKGNNEFILLRDLKRWLMAQEEYQPLPKVAKWCRRDKMFYCSECMNKSMNNFIYCPYCGRKMRMK